MKDTHDEPSTRPVPIRSLKISTDLLLDAEFIEDPVGFAHQRGVDLVGDVLPETSYRGDRETGEKVSEDKANVHLVRHGAIRLLADDGDGGIGRVRSIDMDPSVLLFGDGGYPITGHHVLASLGSLRDEVAPLLADPSDARHIVPGLADKGEPVSYWGAVESEVFLPDIPLGCLHDLGHPKAGSEDGANKTRIQLGDRGNKGDDCVITFEKAKWEATGSRGVQEEVHGIRVSLFLRGRALPAAFARFGTTASVRGTGRLVAFPPAAVAGVHQSFMSQLEGTCLPVPPEWRDRSSGKPFTYAKALALVSQLTAIPVGELRGIDMEVRSPSPSTRKRLKRDIAVEAGRLKPVPVSSLFGSSAYAARPPVRFPKAPDYVDPLVAAAYGNVPSEV